MAVAVSVLQNVRLRPMSWIISVVSGVSENSSPGSSEHNTISLIAIPKPRAEGLWSLSSIRRPPVVDGDYISFKFFKTKKYLH